MVAQLSNICHVHIDHFSTHIYMGSSLAPNDTYSYSAIRFRLQVFLLAAILLASCENPYTAELSC